jgi:hypothetical protein
VIYLMGLDLAYQQLYGDSAAQVAGKEFNPIGEVQPLGRPFRSPAHAENLHALPAEKRLREMTAGETSNSGEKDSHWVVSGEW